MNITLRWKEKLDALQEEQGEPIGDTPEQTVYSAIRALRKTTNKQFSIRPDRDTKVKSVWRLKDKINP